LANPPYIDREKENDIQTSVLENEDHIALFADDQGLSFIYQLINEAPEYIKKGGELWIEFDPWQTDLINEYLKDNTAWSHTYLQDQFKKYRVIILTKN